MKVKSESEVAQSCPTRINALPQDNSPSGLRALLKVLPTGNFPPYSLPATSDYTVVPCELVPADDANSSVNQAQIFPSSVICQRGFPVRLKQSSDAEGSVKGLRNISVTGVGEGPKVR